jgi:hypothetical protein
MFSPSGFLATLFARFVFFRVTKLISPSLSSAVSFSERFDLDLSNACRRVLMRVDFAERFDRAVLAVLVVFVEMLLRTDWKENFRKDDVRVG